MSIKIAHIADVHFRPLSRHAEQRLIFEYFFEKVKETPLLFFTIMTKKEI